MDVFALVLRLKEEGAAAVKAATDQLKKSFNETGKGAKQMDEATAALSRSLRGLAAAAAGAIGTQALANAADTYTRITNQLRLATNGTDELAAAQRRVFQIAQDTAQPFEAVAGLYNRVARSAEALGLSQQEVARVTEFVNQSIALSGSSAAAASGAITQLGQALAAGTLRAEEFNSIQDGAPALIRAVEKELGLQVGQLRQLAMEGKLSSQVFVAAMLENKTVAQEFGTTQRTIEQQMTTLRNQFVLFVGELNNNLGVTNRLNFAIGVLRNNLPQVAAAVAGLTAAWVSYQIAVKSAIIATAVITAAQTIGAIISLAKTIRSLADAAALFSLASGGWVKAAAVIAAITGGVVAWKIATDSVSKATAAANAELDKLGMKAMQVGAVAQTAVKAVQSVPMAVAATAAEAAPRRTQSGMGAMPGIAMTGRVLPPELTPISPAVIERVKASTALAIDQAKVTMMEQMEQASMEFAANIANTLIGSLAAGIETAVATGSIGEGFKALGETLLSGLGSALIMFGTQAIIAGKLMQKFMEAMARMDPFAAVAAGLGMVALGAALKGAAKAAFGGGAQGGGAMGMSTLSVGGGAMQTGGALRFVPTTAGQASQMQPRGAVTVNATIIGPNDPAAQRQIAALVDNAARRGLMQGPALRTT